MKETEEWKDVLIYGSIFDMTDDMTNEEVGLLFNGINDWRKGKAVVFTDRYLMGIWTGILPILNKVTTPTVPVAETNAGQDVVNRSIRIRLKKGLLGVKITSIL